MPRATAAGRTCGPGPSAETALQAPHGHQPTTKLKTPPTRRRTEEVMALTDPAETAPAQDETDEARMWPRARVAGALLAFVAGFAGLYPLILAGQGFARAGAVGMLVFGTAMLLGLLVAAWPRTARDVLGWAGLKSTPGAVAGLCLVLAVGLLVFGFTPVLAAAETEAPGVAQETVAAAAEAGGAGGGLLVANVLLSVVLFAGAALGYLRWAHGRSLKEALSDLGLTGRMRHIALGVALAVAFLGVVFAVTWLLARFGVPTGTGGILEELVRAVSFPQAVVISLGAAVGEEVFFRGFLQPRLGIVPQALLFGLAHASYLNGFEVLVTLIGGVVFGLAYHRTKSLYVPMTAHLGYNMLVFALLPLG